MNDPYRPDLKAGALGTVLHVDDIGTIHVSWDCGSSLGVVLGEDPFFRVSTEYLLMSTAYLRLLIHVVVDSS